MCGHWPEKRLRIAAEGRSLRLFAEHIRNERFRLGAGAASRRVVVQVLPGEEPGLRIEPVAPEITPFVQVIRTFHGDSTLREQDSLSPFVAQ